MIRRVLRIGLVLGALGGVAYVVMRLLEPPQPSGSSGGTSPTPAPPEPWVEPADGACPTSHPVKAKLSSKIFHLPGGASYDRTNADRCYLDAGSAEADGLRPAKR